MTDQPHVEFFEDAAGEWRWHVKAANGEIVCQGESHATREDAERAFVTALKVTVRAHALWVQSRTS